MYYTSMFFSALCFLVIAKHRLVVDSLLLVTFYSQTNDMHWIMYTVSLMNQVSRGMIRAQRVLNLHDIPQEIQTISPSLTESTSSCGLEGAIEFKEAQLRYRPSTEIVLKKLSFQVLAGEKIGIVGRTGAGKSTIFMALARIMELETGAIEIDGVDISTVPLKELRERITMIPQDPTLFTGSLRFNLDPFGEHQDEKLIEMVKKAGLEYIIADGVSKQEALNKEEVIKQRQSKKLLVDEELSGNSEDEGGKESEKQHHGLKFKIQEEGKNLSVGER